MTAALLSLLIACQALAELRITSFTSDGAISITNAFTNSVCTIEKAQTVGGPWLPSVNRFFVQHLLQTTLSVTGAAGFFRASATSISATPEGFTNLVRNYGRLETVAGAGGATGAGVNKWQAAFEGGPAANAQLSRPHIAMADRAGNIFIADKDAHGIRKVRPDGTIITVAGTSSIGNGPDTATPGTLVALNEPNGLFVLTNGTVYVLDLQNGKIRRLDTNGIMTTVVAHGGPISSGRGLWVSEDESILYYASGTVVKRWRQTDGLTDYSTGYSQLGNLAMDPAGRLVVADRSANRVYRIEVNGTKTLIAGNGTTTGGGDGSSAVATGLNQVRAVWFLPTGAFLLGTDNGSQVWYVDTAGTIRLLLHGDASAHTGDGSWFYAPGQPRVSKIRQITMDHEGNLLIAEHDAGYIRKIRFLPYIP